MGDADDGVQHLMWRLRHGEGIASDGPQIAVIMTGSADLTYASFKVGVRHTALLPLCAASSQSMQAVYSGAQSLSVRVFIRRDWKAKHHHVLTLESVEM